VAGTLERLALELVEKRGLDYMEKYRILKFYVETTPQKELEVQIMMIEDIRVFGYVFAIGLPWELQTKAMERWRMLAAE